MTEPTKTTRPITDAIRAILDGGQGVRQKIQALVASTAGDEQFSVMSLGRAARKVMTGAYQMVDEQVEKAVPKDQQSVLRDVVYGIGDAFGAAAKTAGAALDSATAHGREFASDDVKKVTKELRRLASTLVDSVRTSGESAVGHAADFAKSSAEAASKAAEELRPSVEGALSAAAQHPIILTRQAAEAGVSTTRQVAGALFSVLGQMMNKAAEALKVEDPEEASDAAPTSVPADASTATESDRDET